MSFPGRICVSTAIFCITLAGAVVGANSLRAAELQGPRAVIQVPTTEVAKRGSADVNIEYRSLGSSVAGIQFELEYDQNVTVITPAIGSAGVAAGKGLSTAVLPNGNIRIIIAGLNQTVIPDGSIVDLKIQVSPFADSGPQLLRCLNVIGVTPTSQPIPIDAIQGRVVAIPSR